MSNICSHVLIIYGLWVSLAQLFLSHVRSSLIQMHPLSSLTINGTENFQRLAVPVLRARLLGTIVLTAATLFHKQLILFEEMRAPPSHTEDFSRTASKHPAPNSVLHNAPVGCYPSHSFHLLLPSSSSHSPLSGCASYHPPG